MSVSARETSPVRGNRAKAKCTSGWAAFDLKQRQKHQTLEPGNHSEVYPLLSVSTTAPRTSSNQNETLLEKPFSSVVAASVNFPSLVDTSTTDRNLRRRVPVSSSCLGTAQNMETRDVSIAAYQKLKYPHPCADESLIQDVLSGVDNNVGDALSLLEAMGFSVNKDIRSKKVESSGNDTASFDIQGGSIIEKTNISFTNDYPFSKEPKDDLPLMQYLSVSKYLPIEPEPEWEDDDIYLIHRKDAIRMIRSASRHSKASHDAYLRGDHTLALQLSVTAQEEWATAEKLNAKAANEILNVRNCNNDLWTLDLHGLHAGEAVEALRERLGTVESLVSSNCLATLDRVCKESDMFLSASLSSTNHVEVEKLGRQHSPARHRQKLLQVITGKGNHSRGTAALPSTIRSFLSENGYHFDDSSRSGVMMIRPKFRQNIKRTERVVDEMRLYYDFEMGQSCSP